ITPVILTHLAQDPKLASILPITTLQTSPQQDNVYEALLRAIIYQQLSGKAAGAIWQKFRALYQDRCPTPEQLQATETTVLRTAGVSMQKANYLQNVAHFFANQPPTNWEELPDEVLLQQLTDIKGVGVWTVQMLLMFNLGRLDVFPTKDLGIQQAMIQLYELEEKGKNLLLRMEEISKAWQPYRSVASRYLWAWKDNQKNNDKKMK
ncbi:MAG: DNA-3-methyladenine glycosylase family protein, partial [Thermoflexibacteraceae bacterium]